jgi:hypothetical protein
MELGMYIIPPEAISIAYFLNSPISNSNSGAPQIISFYWHHYAYILNFHSEFIRYSGCGERKADDWFFPERIVILHNSLYTDYGVFSVYEFTVSMVTKIIADA